MPYDFRDNRTNYEKEKEVREKRLSAYSEDIQKRTLEQSCELIRPLVGHAKEGVPWTVFVLLSVLLLLFLLLFLPFLDVFLPSKSLSSRRLSRSLLSL